MERMTPRAAALTAAFLFAFMLVSGAAEAQIAFPGPYYPNPAWDQKLSAATRFIVLSNWGGAAVLDRETGLIWERAPSGVAGAEHFTWFAALSHCSALTTGNRMGWRLPTVQDLGSLVDPSVPEPGPALPQGHPFENVQQGGYWTATTHAELPAVARAIVMFNAALANGDKTGLAYAWCVRGGPGPDAQ
jgi:uncharacterized protein DUF1566